MKNANDAGGLWIDQVRYPEQDLHAANKKYVDDHVGGSMPDSLFSPLDITDIVGWWDFTDTNQYTLPSDTGALSQLFSQIADKSGAANHLVQATGGSQPTYTRYGGINDYGFATFAASKFVTKNITQAQPYTIFLVVNIKNFVDAGYLFKFGTGANSLCQKATAYGDVTRHGFGPVTDTYPINDFYYPGQCIIVGFVVNGNDNTLRVFNGAVGGYKSQVVFGGAPAALAKMTIGESINFDLYEAILFSGDIGDANLRRVDDYLHGKYPVDNIINYVACGDSITYGGNSTGGMAGYPVRVAQAKGLQSFLFALPGMTLNNHLRPQYNSLIDRFNKDSYFSFCYGTNEDVIGVNAAWNTSYRLVISKFIEGGFDPARLILVTPPYTVSRAAYNTVMLGYFNQMAADYGVKVADCFTPTYNGGATMTADDIHPTDAGHQVMAGVIETLI